MNKVVIEVDGGCLMRVLSNEPMEYILVDYDNIREALNYSDTIKLEKNDPDGMHEPNLSNWYEDHTTPDSLIHKEIKRLFNE